MNSLIILAIVIKVTLAIGDENFSSHEHKEMTHAHSTQTFSGAVPKPQCDQGTCVRKCCAEESVVDLQVSYHPPCRTATNESEVWRPDFYDSSDISTRVSPPDNIELVIGLPSCPSYVLEPHSNAEDDFVLLSSGHLYMTSLQDQYPPDQYCIDNFIDFNNITYTTALVCFPVNVAESKCNEAKSYVFPVLLLVSCVFLAATLIAFVSVPDLRNKLNGKCLISLVAALMVAYIVLASTSLAKDKIPEVLCRVLASVTHLTLLASFFWLNVMCFDIWRTLSQMRTVSGSPEWVRRRFLLYSLYAWGCPLVVTVAAIIVDTLPDSLHLIRPDFAAQFCWFSSQASKWVYFYALVLALVLANVVFFTMVAVLLFKSQGNSMLNRSREVNRERLWLCVKLFLVMGVCWLAEVVSFQEGSCQAWILTDIINSLQGLSIFIVFVCSKSTLRKVRGEWVRCCGGGGGGGGGKAGVCPSTTLSLMSSTKSHQASTNSRSSSTTKDSPKMKRTSTPQAAQKQNQAEDAMPVKATAAPHTSTVTHQHNNSHNLTPNLCSEEGRRGWSEDNGTGNTTPLLMPQQPLMKNA